MNVFGARDPRKVGCLVAIVLAVGACGSRALSPDEAKAGSGGSGTAGATGAAGGVGTAGVAGTAGAPSMVRIPVKDALTRVSAVLFDQKLDDTTLAQLAQDVPQTKEALEGVVSQMLGSSAATMGVGRFYRWWLGLDAVATLQKDPLLFPAFTPALRADMANETVRFGVGVTLDLDGRFEALMKMSFSWINARLAEVYGVSGVAGDDLQPEALPEDQRAGLLTQPALQALGSFATRNSPSHRGAYILNTFLCEDVPLMPPGVPALGAPPPGESVRQALAMSLADNICAVCHQFIDPFGLAFEGFDAIGRVRAADNGAPVDTTNLTITARPGLNGQVVDGPIALANLMANDPDAKDCFARKWLAFALGRALGPQDEPSVAQINLEFARADFEIKSLIVAVLTSDAFLAP